MRKKRPVQPPRKEDQTRINRGIRVPEVRLIDENGEQMGIVVTDDARRIAEERGLDLVEVAAKSDPPVCRIMDYGKFKYEASKKQHEAKKKQTVIKVKEIKLRPKTEEHDYLFKLKHAREFLEEGNKVKVTIQFRGREMAYQELGLTLIRRFTEDCQDLGQMESAPRAEGRTAHTILSPNKKG
ncbi:MAG: translation initiation factor IF-3 [bacterium]|nr:translation initiation factor IF-3 [bacterium]